MYRIGNSQGTSISTAQVMAFLYSKKPLRHTKFEVEAIRSPFQLKENPFAARNIYKEPKIIKKYPLLSCSSTEYMISGMR